MADGTAHPEGDKLLSNSQLPVDADALAAEIDELANLKKVVSEKNGDLRQRLKDILENRGYHKKAMAVVRDIDAMSETQRADFLRTFEPMFDAMLGAKWREEQLDLLSQTGDDE